jgi:hypothetical protein
MGDPISVISLSKANSAYTLASSEGTAVIVTESESFTATAGQTVFDLTDTDGIIYMVLVNKVEQRPTTEYTLDSAKNTATLTSGATVGDEVTLYYNKTASAAKINVKKAGSTIGTRAGINLIEGTNVTLTVADDSGNDEVDVTIAASGGAGGGTWGSITGTLADQTDLDSALGGKQATLVSATNIKTINSTSLLGSGDIAVQETLVSGTNIKTINSTSLLGSGNISISGSSPTTTVVNGLSSVSNNNYLDIQPGAGAYWKVDNLNYAGAIEIYRSDGTNNIKIDADTTFGARQNLTMRASNTLYPRIKNVSGGDLLLGYNAIIEPGTAVSALTSVVNGAYLDIQPGSGAEWNIENLYYPGAMELYYYDGTNNMKVDADSTFGARYNLNLRCTNTKYYRVKNVSGSTGYFGYDGGATA